MNQRKEVEKKLLQARGAWADGDPMSFEHICDAVLACCPREPELDPTKDAPRLQAISQPELEKRISTVLLTGGLSLELADSLAHAVAKEICQ